MEREKMARYTHRLINDMKTLLKDPKSGFRLLYDMRVRAGRYTIMSETFVEQPYHWLLIRLRPKTTLIDIGANIGDTAIYFGMSERVSRVVAYEPVPDTFGIAKDNVKKSPYYGKISLLNKAVTSGGGSKRIDPEMLGSGCSNFESLSQSERGLVIESVTLQKALRGLKNVAIKCDCEGAEATLFDRADLGNVYAIQVEYHECLDKVLRTLKSKGFKTTHDGTKALGYVYATR